jgi:GNAT superfamily N-acetyltransferase
MREVSLERTELAELSSAILGRGGSLRFEAHGCSMFPSIQDGDVLTIQSVEPASLRMGDVVFYRAAGDRLVAHRVVGRRVQGGRVVLATRGDAARGPPERVQAERVLGRAVDVQRGGRMIPLDLGSRRLSVLLWVRLSPLGPLLFQLGQMMKGQALGLLHQLQALKLYRILARKLVGAKVHYHIATPEDASILFKLYRYERLAPLGHADASLMGQLEGLRDCGHAMIASVGRRMAGAVLITHFPEKASFYPDWWISGMLVRTRYRGAGIGQGLVGMALEKGAEEGATRVNLLVSEHNRVAINLYRKMGFRPACILGLREAHQGEHRCTLMSRPVRSPSVSRDDRAI